MTFWEGRRPSWVRLHKPDAVEVADWAQHAKTALAGVIAWVIAIDVLGLDQPFLAPWAAVLVVHATVYRTVSRGGQQILATFLGVLLAWAVRRPVRGRSPRHGRDAGRRVPGRAAPLAGGGGDDGRDHRHRRTRHERHRRVAPAGRTAAGHLGRRGRRSRRQPRRVAAAARPGRADLRPPPAPASRRRPRPMAKGIGDRGRDLDQDDVEAWMRSCREVDVDIDHAWGLLRQAQESSRLNPRRSQPDDLEEMGRALHLLEEAVAEAISLARTVGTSAEGRERLGRLLPHRGAGGCWPRRPAAIGAGDETALEQVRAELGAAGRRLSPTTPSRARTGTSTAASWSACATSSPCRDRAPPRGPATRSPTRVRKLDLRAVSPARIAGRLSASCPRATCRSGQETDARVRVPSSRGLPRAGLRG